MMLDSLYLLVGRELMKRVVCAYRPKKDLLHRAEKDTKILRTHSVCGASTLAAVTLLPW